MDENLRTKYKFILNTVFYALIIALAYFVLRYAIGWVFPFIIAFFVALAVDPVVKFLQEKCKFKRNFAAAVCTLLFWLILSCVLVLAASILVRELTRLLGDLQLFEMDLNVITNDIKGWMQGVLDSLPEQIRTQMAGTIENLPTTITNFVGSVIPQVINLLTTTLFQVPAVLMFTLITVISTYFISADMPVIKVFIMRQIPEKYRKAALGTRGFFGTTLFKLLKAYALIFLITFAEIAIGLYILGVE